MPNTYKPGRAYRPGQRFEPAFGDSRDLKVTRQPESYSGGGAFKKGQEPKESMRPYDSGRSDDCSLGKLQRRGEGGNGDY